MFFFEIYSKNFKILILVILFYLTFSPLKALDIKSIVKDQTDKIEIAEKGEKLNEFFSENILEIKINDTVKTYKFGIDDYEVFDVDKSLVENGKWKVSGIVKNQIKLQIKNSKENYYFKKISQKPIIYYYDKLPGSEGSKKIQVEIISSNKITKTQITKIIKPAEDQKEISNKTLTKKFNDNDNFKYEEIPENYLKKLSKLKEKSKENEIIMRDENIIEIRAKNIFSSSPDFLASEHCAKYKKFAYLFSDGFSGDLKILTDPNKPLRGNIYKCSRELLLKDPISGAKLFWTNYDEASLYKYPEEHLFLYRDNSAIVEKAMKDKKKENPNFWRENKSKAGTVYYKDSESIHVKGTLTGIWAKETEQLIIKHCQEQGKFYYYFSEDFNMGINQSQYVHCSKENITRSKVSNSNKLYKSNNPDVQAIADVNIFNDIFKDEFKGNQVNSEQLKKYNTSSLTTFYFFEASDNFLSSLELLYRAYDQNVEADQLRAQIEYNKESKYSEKQKLKSTKTLINSSSIKINAKISDASLILSDLGRGYYEQSLPYAFSAAENSYNLFLIVSNTKNNISNSEDLLTGALENLNELVGITSILPNLPEFTKNMSSTIKLIFSGAKSKKIKDKGNLNAALDELTLN